MLGDNAERSKNPLKKAMKRRGAKSVQFAAPTYVEASDYEWSDEEEEESSPDLRNNSVTSNTNGTTAASQQTQTSTADSSTSNNTSNIAASAAAAASVAKSSPAEDTQETTEEAPLSPKIMEKSEAAPLKSRKGTGRNADSFLKDDTAETRKFTLTPNLLRDDSNSGPRLRETTSGSSESSDPFMTDKEAKNEAKKKEKRQSKLSGFFKSKRREKEKEKEKDKEREKSRKKDFVSDGEIERVSVENSRPSTGSLPGDSLSKNREVERQSSQKGRKLQKTSPGSSPATSSQPQISQQPRVGNVPVELEGSQVAFEAPTGLEDEIPITKETSSSFDSDRDDPRNGSFMHGTEAVHIPMRHGDYESSEEDREEDEEEADTTGEDKDGSSTPPSLLEVTEIPEKQGPISTLAHPEETDKTDDDATPTPSKPQSPHPPSHAPPHIPTTTRSASQDETWTDPQRQNSKSSSASSSRANMSPSPASTNATTWSDAGLRAWLDGDNDVRDMLTVIYDTTNVKPVGPEHPLMKDLFREEREGLARMERELDGLLMGFLNRRGGVVHASG